MELTVIVPVYNVESYLRQCVESILAQDFEDFELLLIDDGSTDGSGAICDEYALADSRVRVFHLPNGGVSNARNLGIEKACGHWVAFVDSDDYLEPGYLSSLMRGTASDLAIANAHYVGSEDPIDPLFPSGIFQGKDEIGKLLKFHLPCMQFGTPWTKIFRRDILHIHAIRFATDISTFEDTIFTLQYLCFCNSIYSHQEPLYAYRKVQGSLSRSFELIYRQHSRIHAELNEALAVLETKVGIDRPRILYQYDRSLFLKALRHLLAESKTQNKLSQIRQFLTQANVKKFFGECLLREPYGLKGRIYLALCHRNMPFALLVYVRLFEKLKIKIF